MLTDLAKSLLITIVVLLCILVLNHISDQYCLSTCTDSQNSGTCYSNCINL